MLAGKQALYHGLSEFYKAEHENGEKNIGEALARLSVRPFFRPTFTYFKPQIFFLD